MYQVSTEICFTASHSLTLAAGSEAPHEHRWRVRACVAAGRLDPHGLVMDFAQLGRHLAATVAPLNDASLNDLPEFAEPGINPSAERVAELLYTRLEKLLPRDVSLNELAVWEKPDCRACYTKSGQPD